MKKMKAFTKKHPVWFGGIFFAVVSLAVNLAWNAFTGSVHIYDIVHALPTIFIMGPVIEAIGGYSPTDLIYAPLAIAIDFAVGLAAGWIIGKAAKRGYSYLFALVLSSAVYVILITYQWLPIL